MAIDSLERKITNLSKRNPNDTESLIIPEDTNEKVKKLIQQRKDKEAKENDQYALKNSSGDEQEPEVKFGDIFPDIQEDKFESSDDEEVKKNHRLERFGQVAAPHKSETKTKTDFEPALDAT